MRCLFLRHRLSSSPLEASPSRLDRMSASSTPVSAPDADNEIRVARFDCGNMLRQVERSRRKQLEQGVDEWSRQEQQSSSKFEGFELVNMVTDWIEQLDPVLFKTRRLPCPAAGTVGCDLFLVVGNSCVRKYTIRSPNRGTGVTHRHAGRLIPHSPPQDV